MCGFSGHLRLAADVGESLELVRQMTATLPHRGPDGEGFVARGPCVLGFRRLAIIDVDAPSPPFPNEDQSVWTVTNGEIYNSDELRERLVAQGHSFRTSVDTEVLPHLWEEHGPDLVQHLNGMFAFALWDEKKQTLMLGRDRAGEKPLFYWHDDRELVFASELRALLAHPSVPRSADPVALRRFLLHGYFPAPLTPVAGIRKLPAGHVLLVTNGRISLRRYWDLADYFRQPAVAARSTGELIDEVDARLSTAVTRRRRSDVPIGVFLSGGVDSSTILAHMAEQLGPGVPVFSLGSVDRDFDESRFARVTARHFQAQYHEMVFNEADLDEGLRMVAAGLDEPLGDASIIPTFLLSRFARQDIKVVLSGEGADELFAGYPTYIGNKVAGAYQRIPRPLRRGLMACARALTPVSMGNVGADYLLQQFAAGAECELVERHQLWFGCLGPQRLDALFNPRMREQLLQDDPYASARATLAGRDLPDSLAQLLYTDFCMYLQDNLLTKLDRTTMLVSLEARAPFLDHDLTQFVAGIPSAHKLKGFTTKAILRQAVRRRLPREVLERRKRGFNIPFSRWMFHGLGERLQQRFSRERVEARGLFDPDAIAALLREHLSRQSDHRKPLFALLALDLWCDTVYGDGKAVPLAGGVTRQ